MRKQAEQAMGSNPVSSTPLWPLPELLPPGFYPASLAVLTDFLWWWTNSDFLYRVALAMVFHPSDSNLKIGISDLMVCKMYSKWWHETTPPYCFIILEVQGWLCWILQYLLRLKLRYSANWGSKSSAKLTWAVGQTKFFRPVDSGF